MTLSGVAMPGVLLGDGIDRFTQQVQSLSYLEMKTQGEMWCMVPDQAVAHP